MAPCADLLVVVANETCGADKYAQYLAQTAMALH